MKYFLIILVLVACSKEQEPTYCTHLKYNTYHYDDNWKLVSIFSPPFRHCVPDSALPPFRALIARYGQYGEWLCPPAKDFGKWSIELLPCPDKN